MPTNRNLPHSPPHDFHRTHPTNSVATVHQRLKPVGNRSVCIQIHIIYCSSYLTQKFMYQILFLNLLSKLSFLRLKGYLVSVLPRVLSWGSMAIEDRKRLILVQTSAQIKAWESLCGHYILNSFTNISLWHPKASRQCEITKSDTFFDVSLSELNIDGISTTQIKWESKIFGRN